MNTAASDVSGRLLASTGAVTLSQNILSQSNGGLSGGLNVSSFGNVSFLPFAPVTSVPELSTYLLLLLGAAVIWLQSGKPVKVSGDFAELCI